MKFTGYSKVKGAPCATRTHGSRSLLTDAWVAPPVAQGTLNRKTHHGEAKLSYLGQGRRLIVVIWEIRAEKKGTRQRYAATARKGDQNDHLESALLHER